MRSSSSSAAQAVALPTIEVFLISVLFCVVVVVLALRCLVIPPDPLRRHLVYDLWSRKHFFEKRGKPFFRLPWLYRFGYTTQEEEEDVEAWIKKSV